jgi:hypothetical protein
MPTRVIKGYQTGVCGCVLAVLFIVFLFCLIPLYQVIFCYTVIDKYNNEYTGNINTIKQWEKDGVINNDDCRIKSFGAPNLPNGKEWHKIDDITGGINKLEK